MTATTFAAPVDTAHPDDVPTSSRYSGTVTDLATRVAIVDRHLGAVTSCPSGRVLDAITDLGWEVRLDPRLPVGTLVYQPGLLTLAVREEGELASLLAYAEEARAARAWLRAKVLVTTARLGLDARTFARPAVR